MASLAELEARRAYECRLTPERALASVDEAAAWVAERGLVTGRPCCSLPSLHDAIHEEPYAAGKGGFAEYPRTKWWWGGAIADRPGFAFLKIHRGKGLLMSVRTARLTDPLARAELGRAGEGGHGEEARRLVAHLDAAGPSLIDDLKDELGLDARRLRAVRERLERVAAIVARQVVVPAARGGHRHTSELTRWDQLYELSGGRAGLDELLLAGVRAAVVAPERELAGWFSWRLPPGTVDRLVSEGRLERVDGFVAAWAEASSRRAT